jgi:cyclase
VSSRSTILGLVAGVLLGPIALAQQDFSSVEVQTIPVAEDLYMLVGAGGNMSLSVGSDGAFLVDDEYAPMSAKILAAIHRVTDSDVKFIVNTHWHGDHTGGNENMSKQGAIIVAQENVRMRLSTEQFQQILDRRTPPSPPAALPVVTFQDQINFHWNGNLIRVFHVPNAHTDGDSVVYYTNANVIHMADVFFNGMYPFIDVSSDGSLDGIIAAGERVLAMTNPDTKLIPGHGPLATPDDLRTYLDVLRQARQRIQSLIDQGRSEDEVVAADPTRQWDRQWGAGFMNPESFTRLAYRSLSR